MKKNIYIIAVALAATTFTGCSHDYNYDGEYDIPGYFHGSDPRNNLVYFPTNVQEYTNDFVGDIPVGENSHTFNFTANISRNLTNATKIQVALAADAPLLATTYKDYQVATADQISLPNNGVFDFTTGTTQVNIPVTVNNLQKITKPTVVPVRITPSSADLKNPSTNKQDYAYIVIQPKDVWTAKLIGEGGIAKIGASSTTYTSGTTLNIQFATTKQLTEDCKVGLERDNSLFKSEGEAKLAPEGIAVASQASAKNLSDVQTTVTLQHPEKFTAEGLYILPMRAVYYDKAGNKHYIQGGEVLIPINVADIHFEASSSTPSGSKISSSDYTITTSRDFSYGSIEDMSDEDTEQYTYLPQGTTDITIDLKQTTSVKGISLGIFVNEDYAYYPDYVKVYGSTDGSNWKLMSDKITMNQTTWNDIVATKTTNVRYLKIEYHTLEAFGSLSEIEIFK